MHRDFSNQFVFYLLPYDIYLSSSVGSGRFITLVTVKRTGDNSGYATAEWIWSDLFAWISYDLAHERCLDWIQKEPNPKVYTGRRRFHKIATYHSLTHFSFDNVIPLFSNVSGERVTANNSDSMSESHLDSHGSDFECRKTAKLT